MSRIGAKKKFASTSSNGSNTGKKRSVTNAKVTGRPSTSSKPTVQKYPQNTKRIKTRKGRDEDVRQSIDAKWKNRNENIPHENRESQVSFAR